MERIPMAENQPWSSVTKKRPIYSGWPTNPCWNSIAVPATISVLIELQVFMNKPRYTIKPFLLLAVLAFLSSSVYVQKPPNIILPLTDDLGCCQLSQPMDPRVSEPLANTGDEYTSFVIHMLTFCEDTDSLPDSSLTETRRTTFWGTTQLKKEK